MSNIFTFAGDDLTGDEDAQLVSGDEPSFCSIHGGDVSQTFDDTDEMACLSPWVEVPQSPQYGGGGLTAYMQVYMASDATNDVRIDVFVAAVTPNSDTIDMESDSALAAAWDSANSVSASLSGTTAGDPRVVSVALSNLDSAVAGDWIRFGVRRDTDHADDDASGHMFLKMLGIRETA